MALERMGVTVALTKTEYTCPMHPEVVSNEPGRCSVCGMFLEKRSDEEMPRDHGYPILDEHGHRGQGR